MVMGASLLTLKLVICCGTLSSSTRNFSRGMPGRKCPFLSRTATSNCTVVTSLWKVGAPSGMSGLSFLLNLEGIFVSSVESVESLEGGLVALEGGLVVLLESLVVESVTSEGGGGALFL